MRRCHTCHEPIAPQRLTALPDVTTCLSCSTEEPIRGWLVWEHKTAPVFQVVTPRQHEWLQARDRKGRRSGLPMSSRSTTTPTIAPVSSAQQRIEGVDVRERPRARTCAHHDRPQVSSFGVCLECAMAWYARRIR